MPDRVYDRLKANLNKYLTPSDMAVIDKAYEYSLKAHEGQQRNSGDPFITHPLEVAFILTELESDVTTIAAAILHDTIEDTSSTYAEIQANFGNEIATLVDGVTKLGKIQYVSKEEFQAENLRKMFLAMAKDIRVLIIKLADRLHNLRTLKYMPQSTQVEKANEALEIYAPLAHRLGIYRIKWEMEDLSLHYIDPTGYYSLVNQINAKRAEREKSLNEIIEIIKSKAPEICPDARVEGRLKHYYSIYKKMQTRNITLDQLYDLFAVRIVVNTVQECYEVLGMTHELFKSIPGRIKDYISVPKPNMYQSIHTTLISNSGVMFEVQIRTVEMHKIAEYGFAAHWKYKEGRTDAAGRKLEDETNKFAWLRQLLEWQKDTDDAGEFLKRLKVELFSDEVFVFTPKGDVINLPAGSTPVDFAYSIHSAIGNKMMGAKINGRITPLETKLSNGDIVEVLTSSSVRGPSRDWLKIARSPQARNKINQWFKREERDENIIRGKENLEREIKKNGLTPAQIMKPEWIEVVFKKYTFNNIDDLYAGIGYGGISANKVLSRLKEEHRKTLKPEEALEEALEQGKAVKIDRSEYKHSENGIVVKGIDNCLVRLSRCCNPLPGDQIVGYITRGRGVSVHRRDCVNILNDLNDAERMIDVEWFVKADKLSYKADITIVGEDRSGLILDVSSVLSEMKIPLRAMNARSVKDGKAIMTLTLELADITQLDSAIKKLKRIQGVVQITRT